MANNNISHKLGDLLAPDITETFFVCNISPAEHGEYMSIIRGVLLEEISLESLPTTLSERLTLPSQAKPNLIQKMTEWKHIADSESVRSPQENASESDTIPATTLSTPGQTERVLDTPSSDTPPQSNERPMYRKPLLTDTPRYDQPDPYHEPVD